MQSTSWDRLSETKGSASCPRVCLSDAPGITMEPACPTGPPSIDPRSMISVTPHLVESVSSLSEPCTLPQRTIDSPRSENSRLTAFLPWSQVESSTSGPLSGSTLAPRPSLLETVGETEGAIPPENIVSSALADADLQEIVSLRATRLSIGVWNRHLSTDTLDLFVYLRPHSNSLCVSPPLPLPCLFPSHLPFGLVLTQLFG
jgi:hypothetical protein